MSKLKSIIEYGADGVVAACRDEYIDDKGNITYKPTNLSSISADIRADGYVAIKKQNEKLEKELDRARKLFDKAGIKF